MHVGNVLLSVSVPLSRSYFRNTTKREKLHVTGDSESLDRTFAALAFFGENWGLDRSLEIAADLNNIAKVSTLKDAVELLPSPNASAYADYLCRLGLLCTEEDEPAKIEEAALRCLPQPTASDCSSVWLVCWCCPLLPHSCHPLPCLYCWPL